MLRLTLRLALAASLLSGSTVPTSRRLHPPTRIEYRSSLVLDRYEPLGPASKTRPVVVLIPGCCGDRRDMSALARALARGGATVLNADVHAFGRGGGWPSTYIDVVCSIAEGRRLLERHHRGGQLTLIGWDDGALVAAAVALGWGAFTTRAKGCAEPIPSTGPDRFIGLNGHYGWQGSIPDHIVTASTIEWFGGDPFQQPEAWNLGNPGWWIGSLDTASVPTIFSLIDTEHLTDEQSRSRRAADSAAAFARGLQARGIPVELDVLEPAPHEAVVLPRDVVGSMAVKRILSILGLDP
jgi:hypothetical protein